MSFFNNPQPPWYQTKLPAPLWPQAWFFFDKHRPSFYWLLEGCWKSGREITGALETKALDSNPSSPSPGVGIQQVTPPSLSFLTCLWEQYYFLCKFAVSIPMTPWTWSTCMIPDIHSLIQWRVFSVPGTAQPWCAVVNECPQAFLHSLECVVGIHWHLMNRAELIKL